MGRTKIAMIWAGAILVVATFASIGFITQDMGQGLYYGLLIGAAASIAQTPCRAC